MKCAVEPYAAVVQPHSIFSRDGLFYYLYDSGLYLHVGDKLFGYVHYGIFPHLKQSKGI